MNKRQKETLQAQLDNEKEIIRLLKEIYTQASDDCKQKIQGLASRTDMQNLQSIIYQKQYQEALKKQLDGILDGLQGEEFASVADYLQRCYEDGFVGTLYDLHGQGIPLIFPIDQRQVVRAVETDSKLSEGMYERLGEDVKKLKKSIRSELSRGIANGSTYLEIAQQIADGMNSPFKTAKNNAMRIARTEGGRVRSESQLNAIKTAKEKGADVVKQWDSTLDGKTRPEHRAADGQIREVDEPFDVGGEKMQAPLVGGSARNVCNCRCALLQRARWALDEDELKELQERAAFFGLDKTKDFEDFKQKYGIAVEFHDESDIIKNTSIKALMVTDRAVEAVPQIWVPEWKDVTAESLQAAHRSILRAIQDKPPGTEAGQTFNMDLTPRSAVIYGGNAKSSVCLPSYDTPYITIHNHPDGLTFSHTDIGSFIMSANMEGMSVVGNDGAVYILVKGEKYDGLAFAKLYYTELDNIDKAMSHGNLNDYLTAINRILKGGETCGARFLKGRNSKA